KETKDTKTANPKWSLCLRCEPRLRSNLVGPRFPHSREQQSPDDEEWQDGGHARALAIEEIGDQPDQQWTDGRGDPAGKIGEAEELGSLRWRRQARHERTAGGLGRAEKNAERGRQKVEPELAFDGQDADAKQRQRGERNQDRLLGAEPIVDPSEADGA